MTLILRFVRFQKHYLKVHSLHSIEEIWLKQLCYVKSQLCRNSYYNEEGRDDIKPGRAGMYATIIIVETLTVLEWHPGVSTLRKRKGKSAWVWPEEYSWFTPIGLLDRIRLDSRLPFGFCLEKKTEKWCCWNWRKWMDQSQRASNNSGSSFRATLSGERNSLLPPDLSFRKRT